MERLQKVMAHAGIASRRRCEELILAGQVEVNGHKVTELGIKVDPQTDEIYVQGVRIKKEHLVYILFHKPKQVITSVKGPKGRKTVSDFISISERIYPVGRLDYDTEGLLLLTNDGELANQLIHPKHHVPKVYLATVKGIPHGDQLAKLREGILLDDGITAPAEVEYLDVNPEKGRSVITITIYEGRNRQVRRMFDAIHHPVLKLKRIQFGSLMLEGLSRGKYRYLSAAEIESLKKQVKSDT